jgi:hybrid cluster-associated redox disulfide protein
MRTHPDAVKVLQKHNLGCVGCMGAQNESLEQGANAHGLDVEVLLKDLNAVVR